MNEPQALTFAALDGLAFAAERGRLSVGRELHFAAGALGPLIEWNGLSGAGLLPFPDMTPWLSLNGAAALIVAMRGGQRQWICPTTRAAGFFRTPANWSEDDTKWVGFGLAVQRAATAAGFHHQIAGQFVGAIEEMVSNVYEHSGAPSTGTVVFRAGSDGFEFVVADDGIGVLKSLRSCADYRTVTDHGAALRLALRDGVSRFGPAAKRGNGFRPIFVGLANLSGSLRFRSGDHALVIDGQRIDEMSAMTAQKPRFNGFLASVSCRRP